MTLKLDQWLANSIGKEARISHFSCKVYGGRADSLKTPIKEDIIHEFGEKFLGDADYMLFFKGNALQEADAVTKLSSIVKRALGKASANDLSESDFKVVSGAPDKSSDDEEEGKDEATSEVKYVFVKITIA